MYTHRHQYGYIYIYEMMGNSVYCLNFHPNKIHTYRLTYYFPLHLLNNILSVVLCYGCM